jgi:hypothetical protein
LLKINLFKAKTPQEKLPFALLMLRQMLHQPLHRQLLHHLPPLLFQMQMQPLRQNKVQCHKKLHKCKLQQIFQISVNLCHQDTLCDKLGNLYLIFSKAKKKRKKQAASI